MGHYLRDSSTEVRGRGFHPLLTRCATKSVLLCILFAVSTCCRRPAALSTLHHAAPSTPGMALNQRTSVTCTRRGTASGPGCSALPATRTSCYSLASRRAGSAAFDSGSAWLQCMQVGFRTSFVPICQSVRFVPRRTALCIWGREVGYGRVWVVHVIGSEWPLLSWTFLCVTTVSDATARRPPHRQLSRRAR